MDNPNNSDELAYLNLAVQISLQGKEGGGDKRGAAYIKG